MCVCTCASGTQRLDNTLSLSSCLRHSHDIKCVLHILCVFSISFCFIPGLDVGMSVETERAVSGVVRADERWEQTSAVNRCLSGWTCEID